ncbi:MAG: radical SAM protein [Acidobacteria bacterium]|nr:radical SAM protein [Acidobacteriota bacterium]
MSHKVFLVPVLDRWLLHAPLHNVSAVVNQAAADKLRAADRRGITGDLVDLFSALDETPVVPGPLEGDICPSFLGIIPTRGCNIACVYCNFGGPTAEMTHMHAGIAVAAVDWMAERLERAGRKLFQIHFFGGEPFASPEIVDIVVHRARFQAARRGLSTYSDASTNGVFNESRCRFVGDYFGGIVLSFDGPPEFHNKNRPAFEGRPTFDVVERTARMLSEMPLDLCIRMCITRDSVHHLEEITRWMCESFKPKVVNFETLTPGELPAKAGLLPPDPYDFAIHCMGAYRVAEGYGIKAVYSAAETETPRISFCPVGTDALIVSLDGRASACYLLPVDWKARGLDMDVGWVRENGRVDIDFEALSRIRRLPTEKPRCERCFCQWSCAGGCHVNQTFPGCGLDYTDFCVQTRLMTACLLLRDLGQDALVDQLLANRDAMERTALHPWDFVEVLEREPCTA